MSTRCNIKIIQDNNVCWLYHQHDGYPEYVGKYLLEKLEEYKKGYYDLEDIVNDLIKDIYDSEFEFAIEMSDDIEYLYEINISKDITLKCYKVDIELNCKTYEVKNVKLKEIDLIERLKNK